MRKGESRAGVRTGAVEGSLGEERKENVKSKDGEHGSGWNAIMKLVFYDAISLADTGHRIPMAGQHTVERWRHARRSEQEGMVWMEQL